LIGQTLGRWSWPASGRSGGIPSALTENRQNRSRQIAIEMDKKIGNKTARLVLIGRLRETQVCYAWAISPGELPKLNSALRGAICLSGVPLP
jgi:hypothetical protein